MRREEAGINAEVSEMVWTLLAFLMSSGVLLGSARKHLAVTDTGAWMRSHCRHNNPSIYLLLGKLQSPCPCARLDPSRHPGQEPRTEAWGGGAPSALPPHSLPGAPPQCDAQAPGPAWPPLE